MPDGGDVELHRLAERVEVLVLDGHLVADAGVVDQHADGAEALDGRGDQPLAILGQRQVGGDGERARQVVDERGQPVGAAGGDDDVGPDGVEHAGEAVAETRTRRR